MDGRGHGAYSRATPKYESKKNPIYRSKTIRPLPREIFWPSPRQPTASRPRGGCRLPPPTFPSAVGEPRSAVVLWKITPMLVDRFTALPRVCTTRREHGRNGPVRPETNRKRPSVGTIGRPLAGGRENHDRTQLSRRQSTALYNPPPPVAGVGNAASLNPVAKTLLYMRTYVYRATTAVGTKKKMYIF